MSASNSTDGELLDRYRHRGDEEAFRLLLVRHEGWVRQQCRRMLRDDDAADEACQAVFVLLSRRAGDIRDGGCLAAWLQQVAHGITCNLIKAERRLRRLHDRGDEALASLPDHVRNEDREHLIAAQASLPDCLAELQPIDREVVIRHYLRCQSQIAIAAELGLSAAAVQKRVTRAIVRLRALMQRRGVVMTPALLMALWSPARAEASVEQVDATMGMIGPRGQIPATVTELAAQAEARLATAAWLRWAGHLAMVAGLALMVGLSWWSLSGRTDEANGALLLERGPGVVTEDAQGRVFNATVGLRLAAGTTITTAQAGEVVVGGDGGRWTLRPGGQAVVTADGLRLVRGAVVCDTAVGSALRIELPRLHAVVTGQSWLMTVPSFDRVDVVEGQATVGSDGAGLVVARGQALTRGPGCPVAAQPRSPHELSPAFGGVFFRPVAECYARGHQVLARGPGRLDVQQVITAEAPELQAALATATGVQATAMEDRLILRQRNRQSATVSLTVKRPAGAPAAAVVSWTDAAFAGQMSINDGAVEVAYAACAWRDPAVPDGLSAPAASRTPITAMLHASILVGILPDGRKVWEKTLAYDPDGPWQRPVLRIGDGPLGWQVILSGSGVLGLRSLRFAQGATVEALASP